jgi:redox-sensitive bicupin YhaK (pirin superfamily)
MSWQCQPAERQISRRRRRCTAISGKVMARSAAALQAHAMPRSAALHAQARHACHYASMNTSTVTFVLAQPRRIERVVAGQATRDGAGVKLTRVLTQDLQRRLDPFLMLDAFGTDHPGDYIGGFPDHPHRGFETVSYMLDGRMRHRDSAGHQGLISGGGVQWMTAGRGVIHSEMPEQEAGRMEGFQLWLNLPAKDKMCAPWYRDIPASGVPEAHTPEGATVRVIAGSSHGVAGAVQREATAPLYLDLHLPAGASFEQLLPSQHNAFVYVYRGEVELSGPAVPKQRMAILANAPGSDGVRLRAGAQGARALLIAGRPLNEPIAQHGPFVMNSHQQIFQAVEDFRAGRLA